MGNTNAGKKSDPVENGKNIVDKQLFNLKGFIDAFKNEYR